MSIFDVFKPQWKKQFDELRFNHRQALEAYIQCKYVVYPDMRIDDRLLIQDYIKVYEKNNYPQSIDELTVKNKKELAYISDNIIRLYKAFSKYETKQKRVQSLMNRFDNDNVFNSVFGNSYMLGSNWTLESLEDAQFDFILNNYQKLIDKATIVKENKERKLAKQKQKILGRAYLKQAEQIIKKQEQSETILFTDKINSETTKIICNKITDLRTRYRSFNAYKLIRRIVLLGFEDAPKISRHIYVLSREKIFEEGYKAFLTIKHNYWKLSKLTNFLQSTENKELCINDLFLNHNYQILEDYIEKNNTPSSSIDTESKSAPTQNTIHYTTKKTNNTTGHYKPTIISIVNSIREASPKNYSTWESRQNTFNDCLEYWQSALKDFRYTKTFTPIDAIEEGKNVKRHLTYIQIMKHVYSNPYDSSDMGEFRNYTKVQELYNFNKKFSDTEFATMSDILNFIDKIDREINSLSVVLGTSGVTNPLTFNSYHMKRLIDDIHLFGVPITTFDQLDSLQDPKYIIILELISSIKNSREERRRIIEKFPGIAICYLSIFKEKSQSGYELS